MDNSILSLLTELKDLKADIENETQAAKREIERAAQLSIDKLNDVEKKASAKIDNIIVMLENLQENEVACTSDTGPVQQSAQQLLTSQPTLSPESTPQKRLSQSLLVPRLGQQQQAPSQSPQQALSQSPPSQSPLPLPLTTMPYTPTQQSQPTVTSQANGNRICGGCMTCDMLREEATFTSTTTGKRYDVIGFATCRTSNVVYLIQCALCNQQYVGMTTQPLHKRMNSHRSDIYNDRNNGGVARHFCSDGHTLDHFTVMVIEVLDDPSRVRPREKYWIVELQTLCPNGMNLRC